MKRKIEEQLIAWKQKTADRLPLIVNGARQVGKTYILRKFGEEQFQNVVYINLETNLTSMRISSRSASCGIWRRPPGSASFRGRR